MKSHTDSKHAKVEDDGFLKKVIFSKTQEQPVVFD